ncbi:hypothetical protein BB934_07915 [Microvirga ossetica]|uniref:Uncharacterized protein n=1 Tax=Microvirga ossetica TaxID=1882682 RepID=A0A1B2EDV8_9HYPH|nr:hypothetical protein BB934_07915 [Microvirga ossetica]
MVQAILDRAHDAVDLALNGHALRFNLRSLATCFLGQPVHLFLVRTGEFRHQLRREQVENTRLDLLAADRAVIPAYNGRSRCGDADKGVHHLTGDAG